MRKNNEKYNDIMDLLASFRVRASYDTFKQIFGEDTVSENLWRKFSVTYNFDVVRFWSQLTKEEKVKLIKYLREVKK